MARWAARRRRSLIPRIAQKRSARRAAAPAAIATIPAVLVRLCTADSIRSRQTSLERDRERQGVVLRVLLSRYWHDLRGYLEGPLRGRGGERHLAARRLAGGGLGDDRLAADIRAGDRHFALDVVLGVLAGVREVERERGRGARRDRVRGTGLERA